MTLSLEQLVVPLPGMELLGERKAQGRAGVCLDVSVGVRLDVSVVGVHQKPHAAVLQAADIWIRSSEERLRLEYTYVYH